jgi:ABC-type cobalamin/Fe3+-siderophores transport system ATPase subunit
MSRKFGKKKEIKIDPLAYNLGILGISGIGKSGLCKQVCEMLAGEQGYIALDMGE